MAVNEFSITFFLSFQNCFHYLNFFFILSDGKDELPGEKYQPIFYILI